MKLFHNSLNRAGTNISKLYDIFTLSHRYRLDCLYCSRHVFIIARQNCKLNAAGEFYRGLTPVSKIAWRECMMLIEVKWS